MSQLITLSPVAQQLDENLMDQPGAFLWWYVDMVDEQGNGVVFIWSYGLPFLPGLANAAREGQPQKPGQRPSLNICIYVEGELDFYSLQEFEPEQVSWQRGELEQVWQFGDNVITRCLDEKHVKLDIKLSGDVPGSMETLEGEFTLKGVRRLDERPDMATDPDHDWTPITAPCRGVLYATCGRRVYHIEGRAYHDRNSGRAPLHELGFSKWVWGRVPMKGRELIYYVLWPEDEGPTVCLGLIIDEDGKTTRVDNLRIEMASPRLSWAGGLMWHRRLFLYQEDTLWLDVDVQQIVDQGPFYMRYFTQVTHQGETTHGIGEFCVPTHVDKDIHRPLVQMRVQAKQNSMWLPLFSGPRKGRLKRLVTQVLLNA